ncbi:BglG family transcription antiterminator [Halobacillus litoralis]|uniref:Ascorbate-specific PTS system EIIA component n=1 Tax=Halobacillus litoralis TaxID=45668 RepID=A0A410MA27_9BACI|nr:BglG family transcription antiterminator [Halobacillus litoralis]QAS51520.1 transcription antiterminator BglG [Halobacillus litoralis]
MALNERSKKILDDLVINPRISSTTLEKKHNLTRRQLGYSFNKINEWLLVQNLPHIERTKQGQFIIDQSIFTKVNSEDRASVSTPVLSEKQRTYLIILMLISREGLSLNHFTLELDFSKNTILHDLKQAQAFLDDYNLTIKYSRKSGYLLEGEEFQIRRVLIRVVYELLSMHSGAEKVRELALLSADELKQLTSLIEKFEAKIHIQFTDEKIETLPYILTLISRRISKGYVISTMPVKHEDVSNTKEFQAIEEIFHAADIPEKEQLFITLHLLTTNVYRSEELSKDETMFEMVPAVKQMLQLFERSACIYFKDREQLVEKLFQHLRPAYYRIKYELTEAQPIQDFITEELIEVHHLVKRSISPLEDFIGHKIPENEIIYVTMLLGGWMTRQGESIEKKVKAIVVCPQGVSVSRLLFNQLKDLFPEFVFLDSLSVREYTEYGLDYDFIFSTTPLSSEGHVFMCQAFLDQEDRLRLRKQVMMEVQGFILNDIHVDHLMDIIRTHTSIKDEKALVEELHSYVHRDEESSIKQSTQSKNIHLDDLLPTDHISLEKSVQSWEEAIRIASMPLVSKGYVEEHYVEAMIQQNRDPYIVIAPHLAIPHAAPENGVNKVGMSLLKIEEGVTFTEEETVHIIVVIAAVDKRKHMHALMQLMNLAGSEEDRNRIIESRNSREIEALIQQYSNE